MHEDSLVEGMKELMSVYYVIGKIQVCSPKIEYSSRHCSHALRGLAANFFAKGAVSNEACISGKAIGCHEPLEGDWGKSARGRLYGGQWLPFCWKADIRHWQSISC